MKIKSIPYSLKFKEPFGFGGKQIDVRDGFIINIKDSDGYTGIGDCSPFPGFGCEELTAATEKFDQLELDTLDDDIISSLRYILLPSYPALLAGIEQAYHSYQCKKYGLNIYELLNLKPKAKVSINGIVGISDVNNTISKVKLLSSIGFRTIKLKIGREEIDEDIDIVSSIQEKFPTINLRLDANRFYDYDKAEYLLSKLRRKNIEYIEDITKSHEDIPLLKKESKFPLALDELLGGFSSAADLISMQRADVFIFKPIPLGGLTSTLKLIELCKYFNKKSVVTTTLDSVIGRKMAIVAGSVLPNDTVCGLNTSSLMFKDLPYKDIHSTGATINPLDLEY